MLLINEARSWIGTKFKHQGRIKINKYDAGGCDCLGLMLGLGIKTKTGTALKSLDVPNYPRLLQSNQLLEQLNILLEPVDELYLENLILIKVNKWPQHLAIITSLEPEITIIHSYLQAGKVVEQHLPEEWKKDIVAIYKINAEEQL